MISSGKNLLKACISSAARPSAVYTSPLTAQRIIVEETYSAHPLSSAGHREVFSTPYTDLQAAKGMQDQYFAGLKSYIDQTQTVELCMDGGVVEEPIFECRYKKAAKARMKRIRRKKGNQINTRWK